MIGLRLLLFPFCIDSLCAFKSPDPDLLELVFDCSESSSDGQVEGDDMISLRKEQSHIIKEDSDSSSSECCGFETGKEG